MYKTGISPSGGSPRARRCQASSSRALVGDPLKREAQRADDPVGTIHRKCISPETSEQSDFELFPCLAQQWIDTARLILDCSEVTDLDGETICLAIHLPSHLATDMASFKARFKRTAGKMIKFDKRHGWQRWT